MKKIVALVVSRLLTSRIVSDLPPKGGTESYSSSLIFLAPPREHVSDCAIRRDINKKSALEHGLLNTYNYKQTAIGGQQNRLE